MRSDAFVRPCPPIRPERGCLEAFRDANGRPAWRAEHPDGRREYFPACPVEVARATAERLLGLPVRLADTPLTRRLADA